MKRLFLLLLPFALVLSAGDCTEEPPEEEEEVTPGEPCPIDGQSRCDDTLHQTCVEHEWVTDEECAAPTPQCNASVGCIGCGAGQDYCVGNAVYRCNEDGTDWALVEECGEDACQWGECVDMCRMAAETGSYLGCEFLAVPTANSELVPDFSNDFAVVVGNPDEERVAEITVERGGETLASELLQPRETRAIQLPYDDVLKASDQTVIVPDGAYEVTASHPIVAYQYNPLNFQTGATYSYTNDASLLLPVPALGDQYLVSTWPTFGLFDQTGWLWSSGFVAVAASTDDTTVWVTSSAYTLGGQVQALSPGDVAEVHLDRGDVLQLFSEVGTASGCGALEGALEGDAEIFDQHFPACLDVERGDLTGTRVQASEPVMVFAGHDCSFVPFERWACDHLEESMLPLEVWGTDAMVAAPTRPGGTGIAPTLVRVLAMLDGTDLTFTPAVHEPVTAGPSSVIEFRAEEDVLINAHGPILVTQFLLGEQELGANAGDPAMGTIPPSLHWRTSYEFLVPSTYEDDYVNIFASLGATVTLDGNEITAWDAVDDTPFKVHRARLYPGPHTAESPTGHPFGLMAYGYASFTSYYYPGGLDLTHNPLP